MRSSFWLAGGVLFACAARGDLLWNNYQGPEGFDRRTYLSSERDTIISDSWTVDDAVFGPLPIEVQALKWIGLRDQQKDPYQADFIILDDSLNVVAEMEDVAYTTTPLDTGPDGMQIYEGMLEVPDIVLAPGHYFFGARLADAFLGRNFAATTGNTNILGLSMGLFRSVTLGADDWTPVDQILSDGRPSDFAFQVLGVVIPEPSSVILLGIGSVLSVAAMRRRRR